MLPILAPSCQFTVAFRAVIGMLIRDFNVFYSKKYLVPYRLGTYKSKNARNADFGSS